MPNHVSPLPSLSPFRPFLCFSLPFSIGIFGLLILFQFLHFRPPFIFSSLSPHNAVCYCFPPCCLSFFLSLCLDLHSSYSSLYLCFFDRISRFPNLLLIALLSSPPFSHGSSLRTDLLQRKADKNRQIVGNYYSSLTQTVLTAQQDPANKHREKSENSNGNREERVSNLLRRQIDREEQPRSKQ